MDEIRLECSTKPDFYYAMKENGHPEHHDIVHETIVMFYDTDAGGVVHNLAYLRMIEEARTLLAVKLGMDWQVMGQQQIFPVVTNIDVRYIKAGRLGDTIQIRGGLREKTGVRFWFEFEVYRKAEDELLVKARQELAIVKMPEGKVLRLPKGWPDAPWT